MGGDSGFMDGRGGGREGAEVPGSRGTEDGAGRPPGRACRDGAARTAVLPLLVGREAPLAALRATLALLGDTGTGSALLLRGDPGMGKSALLAVAEVQAREAGLRVLRMTGAAAETGLPFAALHQVGWLLLADAPELTDQHIAVLEGALGMRGDVPPDVRPVAEAALALLAGSAAQQPLVVLLDDLHWADPASAAVFAHLAQNVARLPLVLLGATRHQGPAGFDRFELRPLSGTCAGQLLRALHPWMPDALHTRVLDAAGGNPLALHELPEQARKAKSQGASAALHLPGHLHDALPGPPHDPLPAELTLGPRLGRLYEADLRVLPDDAWRLLLLVALGGARHSSLKGLRALAACSAPATRWPETWQHIESSGLAHLDPAGERVEFRHPLVRACLLHLCTPTERRAAHRLLAAALPVRSPQRTAHLAAAAVGADGALAALLRAEADELAVHTGQEAAAAAKLARAATLSPDPAIRSAWLIEAAALSVRGARLLPAAELLAAACTRAPEPGPFVPYALAVAATRLHLDADPAPALALLPDALDVLPGGTPLHEQLLHLLAVVTLSTGDARGRAAVDRHAPHASQAARLCWQAWTDADSLAVSGAEPPPEEAESTGSWRLLQAAVTGESPQLPSIQGTFVRRHSYVTQAFADSLRAHDDFLSGRWEESLAASREGERICRDLGYAFHGLLFGCNVAQVFAARGDRTALAALEPVLTAGAQERHLHTLASRLQDLKLLCLLGQGSADDAWHQVQAQAAHDDVAPRTPWTHLRLLDWVQAAVESGHRSQAQERLRAVREPSAPPPHAFLLAAADALAAPDDETAVRERYEKVYAHPYAQQRPFQLARVHLAHADALHRQGAAAPAVEHGRRALTLFARLGATPWADRARRRITGPSEPVGIVETFHPLLSAQELRIAELAAQGLTNRRIAERLMLSPRTVGAHLYKIFPKLGITHRAAVAHALEETRSVPPRRP